ncbi:MAG: hypothetical protein ACP5RE_03590 [Candidatus Acidifodinimicrobium sp.]
MSWGRNRQNGVKAEGDLMKLLEEDGMFTLSLSPNIAGDIILPHFGVIIEVKRVKNAKTFVPSKPNQVKQYERLKKYVDNGMKVFYSILFYDSSKDDLSRDRWRFFVYKPDAEAGKYKMKFDEGISYNDFIVLLFPQKD